MKISDMVVSMEDGQKLQKIKRTFSFLEPDECIEVPQGTVLCYTGVSSTKIVMFQTLDKIILKRERVSRGIAFYLPGSIYGLNVKVDETKVVPTFRLRDCRFPTHAEYLIYNRKSLV